MQHFFESKKRLSSKALYMNTSEFRTNKAQMIKNLQKNITFANAHSKNYAKISHDTVFVFEFYRIIRSDT